MLEFYNSEMLEEFVDRLDFVETLKDYLTLKKQIIETIKTNQKMFELLDDKLVDIYNNDFVERLF